MIDDSSTQQGQHIKMVVNIGDIVIMKLISVDKKDPDMISRTASVYSYGDSLVLCPSADKEYVVCTGDAETGFLLAQRDDYDAPVGFALVYQQGLPHFVITQVGFQPEPVELSVVGQLDKENIPSKYPIGSQLFVVHAL